MRYGKNDSRRTGGPPGRRWLLRFSVFVCLALPGAARGQTPRPIMAVFDIENRGARLDRKTLAKLTVYLSSRIAASGLYRVVPRKLIAGRLKAQKRHSYHSCFDQSCQIEIGKELAANKSLATRLMQIGARCVVTSTLYDLKGATTERGAVSKGGCGEEAIMASIEKVSTQVCSRRASPGAGHARKVPPARLDLSGRPAAAVVHLERTASGTSAALHLHGRLPHTFHRLVPSSYRVTVTAPGFMPLRRAVELKAGQGMKISVNLRRASRLAVTSRISGKCLDVSNYGRHDGANVVQFSCHGRKNQQWKLDPVGKGAYRLISAHSNKCLDVQGYSRSDNANVVQHSCHGKDNQAWKLRHVDGEYYLLISRVSGKCLDVSGYGQGDNANVVQFSCHRRQNQQWRFDVHK